MLPGRTHLRIEAYRKGMSRLRPRYENLFDPFGFFPEADGDRARIEPDAAEARGVEVAVRRRGGKASWWASYTLASAEDEFDGFAVPRSWDQRHAVDLGVNYRIGSSWNLNLAGLYHTGWPTTGVTAVRVANPDGSTSTVPVFGPRNAERFPDYHRIDMRVSRSFSVKRGQFRFFFEVLNLLDRRNPCCVTDFAFVSRTDGSAAVSKTNEYWLRRIPSFGVTWEF
jgi:hypothetical protein